MHRPLPGSSYSPQPIGNGTWAICPSIPNFIRRDFGLDVIHPPLVYQLDRIMVKSILDLQCIDRTNEIVIFRPLLRIIEVVPADVKVGIQVFIAYSAYLDFHLGLNHDHSIIDGSRAFLTAARIEKRK